MFINMNLLATLPAVGELADALLQFPGEVFTAAVLTSQLMSNVPAAMFLESFTDDWRGLAWGVSVGGFGLAIGSLANLIALRLARQRGLWREFHYWSVPALLGGWLTALVLGHYWSQSVPLRPVPGRRPSAVMPTTPVSLLVRWL